MRFIDQEWSSKCLIGRSIIIFINIRCFFGEVKFIRLFHVLTFWSLRRPMKLLLRTLQIWAIDCVHCHKIYKRGENLNYFISREVKATKCLNSATIHEGNASNNCLINYSSHIFIPVHWIMQKQKRKLFQPTLIFVSKTPSKQRGWLHVFLGGERVFVDNDAAKCPIVINVGLLIVKSVSVTS